MKHPWFRWAIIAGAMALMPAEASAMVCARGIVRAGCVGPNGAVAVRRGVVAPRVGMYGRGVRGVAFRGGVRGFRR
nr:hypothetical protein [Methylorubrum extorquens]